VRVQFLGPRAPGRVRNRAALTRTGGGRGQWGATASHLSHPPKVAAPRRRRMAPLVLHGRRHALVPIQWRGHLAARLDREVWSGGSLRHMALPAPSPCRSDMSCAPRKRFRAEGFCRASQCHTFVCADGVLAKMRAYAHQEFNRADMLNRTAIDEVRRHTEVVCGRAHLTLHRLVPGGVPMHAPCRSLTRIVGRRF